MKILSTLLPFLLIILDTTKICFAQFQNEDVVASVGTEVITEDDFIKRYELTPQLNAGMIGSEEAAKKEFLYSLIAEKLWALEAKSIGLDKADLIASTYRAIEKMYVRDALYREEILDKVELTNEYLTQAFQRSSKILNLNYIYSENYKEIESIYQQLKDGANFYTIMLQRPESKLQEMPYTVSYGKMDKGVEDELYSLKLGEITAPIKAPNGWYVFKLLSIQQKVIENSEQAQAEEKNVLKIARQTVIDSLYKEFFTKFFNNVNAETNKELLLDLSDLVFEKLQQRSQLDSISENDKIYLSSDDLYDIEADLGSEKLNAVFIKLDGEPETIDDFLQELAIEKFYADSLDIDHIRGRLNYYVRKFIEHELFAREGYKRGLQNSSEVKRDTDMWKSYYLSEALRKVMIDSIEVTEGELKDYTTSANLDSELNVEVKIIELLTDDLDIVKLILDKLENGAEFQELAVKYTIREEAKNNNGELGYFNINEFGEIGVKAAQMQIGEMYGPIKVSEGYSLFELVDRKEIMKLPADNYEIEQEQIKIELKNKKYYDMMINKTVELANKYNIKIDEQVLSSTEVLNTTTVIYRIFGFGGKLLAVPMTFPNYNWFKLWKQQAEVTP